MPWNEILCRSLFFEVVMKFFNCSANERALQTFYPKEEKKPAECVEEIERNAPDGGRTTFLAVVGDGNFFRLSPDRRWRKDIDSA